MILIQEINSENFLKIVHSCGWKMVNSYRNCVLKDWCKKFKKVCVLQRRACTQIQFSNAITSKTTTIQNMP